MKMGKGYTKKELIPIRNTIIITINELAGFLNLVRLGAESYIYAHMFELAKKIIEKYKKV